MSSRQSLKVTGSDLAKALERMMRKDDVCERKPKQFGISRILTFVKGRDK